MNPKRNYSDEEIKGGRKSFTSRRKGLKYNSVRTGRSKRNHELARIGPGGFVEALDRNPATSAKLAFVNHIGSFLTVLRHDVFRRENIRGHFQLLKAVLSKARQRIFLIFLPTILYRKKNPLRDHHHNLHINITRQKTK